MLVLNASPEPLIAIALREVPCPVLERRWRAVPKPRYEVLRYFVIMHCVGVRRISNEDVGCVLGCERRLVFNRSMPVDHRAWNLLADPDVAHQKTGRSRCVVPKSIESLIVEDVVGEVPGSARLVPVRVQRSVRSGPLAEFAGMIQQGRHQDVDLDVVIVLKQGRKHDVIARREHVVPVCPSAFPTKPGRLLTRLYRHIGNQSFCLPLRHIRTDVFRDFLLANFVFWSYGRKERCGTRLVQRLLLNPLNRVKPLLKQVARTRRKIAFLPWADVGDRLSVPSFSVPSERTNGRRVNLIAYGMHHATVLHGSFRRFRKLFVGNRFANINSVPLSVRLRH